MRLSARTTYAIRALVYMASQADGSPPARVEAIARSQHIPPRFLPQIMSALKSAGLVKSRRGLAGGYVLARPARELSLADVLACFEGTAPAAGASDDPVALALVEVSERVDGVLRNITIASLAERVASNIPQYAI